MEAVRAISPPIELTEAVAQLWQLNPPAPANLLAAPTFVHLRETCQKLYGLTSSIGALSFALSNALQRFGLPSGLSPEDAQLALSPEVAAARLDAAFRATHSSRLHLCPLDLADELPILRFGPNSIEKFSAADLNAMINPETQKRVNPSWTFDAQRFSEFSWLVVREDVAFDREPAARALPVFFMDLNADLGRIDPHPERFPSAVEAALFCVLHAPWEDWAEMAEIDWRPFRIPWVYSIDNDAFVRPVSVPSPDTLSWEPHIYTNYDGDEVEVDRPTAYPLTDSVSHASSLVNDATWADLQLISKSVLFETPISHFLIRAFSTEGIDGFLAHVTLVEAALGLKIDHQSRKRRKLSGHGNPGATFRVATRLLGLLGAKADGEAFRRLFTARSEYLHGRQMSPISTPDRILARRLARRTVEALGKAALAKPLSSREAYLEAVLDAGLQLI